MLGCLLAGIDESPGEMVLFQGRRYKSTAAWARWARCKALGADRYGQQDVEGLGKLVPEGIEGRVPYKARWPTSSTSWSAVCARHGLRRRADDRGPAQRAVHADHHRRPRESHPHDVTITKEAPNYRATV